jgi:hypothetical protein
LGLENLQTLFIDLGFYDQPVLRLDTGPDMERIETVDPATLALGGGGLLVSPLQLALAAAAISSDGTIPPPRLAMSLKSPETGWTLLPATSTARTGLTESSGQRVSGLLALAELPIWQTTATIPVESDSAIAWYVAGTTGSWQGAPLAMAMVLEDANQVLAERIGQQVLKSAMSP